MTLRQAKPFNVTLIRPAKFVHALALKEAADYVHATLRALGLESQRTVNHVSSEAFNIIFCAHLLLDPGTIRNLPGDTIIFNSEQLDDVDGWHFTSGLYPEMLRKFVVWDYSLKNLSKIPHDRKCFIPFLFCPALQRSDIRRKRGLKLLFYGSLNPRRADILTALKRGAIPLEVVVDRYEFRRDVKMLRSWAILNLHKSDATVAFEPIRCFYPLINQVPVISEEVGDASADAFRDAMFFFERGCLIEGIIDLYRKPEVFANRSASMLASFRDKSPLPDVAAAVEQFLSGRP